jgi:hypothetical protein
MNGEFAVLLLRLDLWRADLSFKWDPTPMVKVERSRTRPEIFRISHSVFASCRFLPSCHALIGQVTVSTVGSSFGQAISYGGRTSVLLTVDLGSEANSFYLFLAQYQLAETRLRP